MNDSRKASFFCQKNVSAIICVVNNHRYLNRAWTHAPTILKICSIAVFGLPQEVVC